MNFTTLKQIVDRALQASEFEISGATLQSSSVTVLFRNFFSSDRLQLSNASKRSESDTSVVIRGELTSSFKGLSNLQAVAAFEVVNSEAEIRLQMTGLPQNWKLSDLFPTLKASLFDDFAYARVTLILDSQDKTPLPQDFPQPFGYRAYSPALQSKRIEGLSLQATLTLQSGLEGLEWFLSGSQWEIEGVIVLFEDKPSICLQSVPQDPLSIAGYEIPFLLNLVSVLLEPIEPSAPPVLTVCMQLEAVIEKDINGTALKIPVYFREHSSQMTVLNIWSNLSSASHIAFEEISSLISGASVAGQIPP
ncbi:MAG: hypothetical protein AAGG51_21005 [Cyanobacteria bacterium P01_G01_bin.54]